MKLALQLAYRNLIGAGLKTWLNVGILAFTFLLIIFYNGMMDGWNFQAVKDSIAWEYGQGQYLAENYDPTDPFTIKDGYQDYSTINDKSLTPILVQQGTIYPEGRMSPVLLKGIPADQTNLLIPVDKFPKDGSLGAIIGKRFAKNHNLATGDNMLMRWRDKNGTFDATDITIVDVFSSDVPTVDAGTVWLSLSNLQTLTGLPKMASYIVNTGKSSPEIAGWTYKSKDVLLSSLYKILDSKKASGAIMYILLLAIALLAIFDTQVLSIFRRQKEIGTYISLGMTRAQVVKLFTVEGAMYSILATIAAIIVGVPLFAWLSKVGISIPAASQGTNLAMGDILYPAYTFSLVITTILLIVISSTFVSYLPARKISKMDPVNALKGKIQ